jgi:hypothetical protein
LSDSTTGKVAVGEIVGYKRPLIPLGKNIKVLIRVDSDIVTVLVDYRQLRFIQDKYKAGRKVAVGFYGGEWHIGSPPAPSNEFMPERDIAEIGLLKHETDSIDLLELVTRPVIDVEAASGQQAIPERPSEEAGAIWANDDDDERVLVDSMLEELDEYRECIKHIEQTVKDNSDELLQSFGLSHLTRIKEKPNLDIKKQRNEKTHKPDSRFLELLDSMIAQHDEIISNQKEIIRLLKRYHGFNNEHESMAKLN